MNSRSFYSTDLDDQTTYLDFHPNLIGGNVAQDSGNLEIHVPQLTEQTRQEIDSYLSSMNPLLIVQGEKNESERTLREFVFSQSEEGRDNNIARVCPERKQSLYNLIVKCTPSSEEIVGSPSDVAVRLNEEIQRYLPSKRVIVRREVVAQVSEARDQLEEKKGDHVLDKKLCPAGIDLKMKDKIPAPPKCPGLVDIISRKITPCYKLPTLREIALGRKMPIPKGINRPNQQLDCPDENLQRNFLEECNDNYRHHDRPNYPDKCCTRKKINRN